MKWVHRIYVILFIALAATAGTLVLVLPQNEFSENENRVLEQIPSPDIDDILSGDFQDKFEKAVSDQFPLRDTWTGASTGIRRLMGLHDAGGVYLGQEGYYFEKKLNKDVPMSQYKKNIALLKKFADEHPRTQVLLVPSAATILPEKLPAFSAVYDSETMYQIAKQILGDAFIDVRLALQMASRDKQVYYRTDHHWTADGAYAAFREWALKNGRANEDIPEFSYKKVTDSFLGTTYSKALDMNPTYDSILIPEVFKPVYDVQGGSGSSSDQSGSDMTDSSALTSSESASIPSDSASRDQDSSTTVNISEVPDIPIPLTVTINGKPAESIYAPEKLETKDKYAVFFGGNYAEVNIQNPTDSNSNEIVIFKDSYANCFTPMLIPEYSQITLIDLRYETRPVREVMAEHPDADCLVLYEMSTFATSSEVARLGL
ncbi:MAG: hypothetical protein J5819_06375 [Eubacterium sp.]|nr:hypothetical protein [Eubacterium sp.]